jgi:hypothetical protein
MYAYEFKKYTMKQGSDWLKIKLHGIKKEQHALTHAVFFLAILFFRQVFLCHVQ